jgi:hypothetical protein
MATTDIKITNADINSGVAVNLAGVDFKISLPKNSQADPLAGTTTYRLPTGKNLGIDTPAITINGVIDVDQYTNNTNLWSTSAQTVFGKTNVINLGILYTLWKTKSDITLVISFGIDTSEKNWYKYDLTGSSMKVLLKAIDISPDTGSDRLHMINYSMTFVEVA